MVRIPVVGRQLVMLCKIELGNEHLLVQTTKLHTWYLPELWGVQAATRIHSQGGAAGKVRLGTGWDGTGLTWYRVVQSAVWYRVEGGTIWYRGKGG